MEFRNPTVIIVLLVIVAFLLGVAWLFMRNNRRIHFFSYSKHLRRIIPKKNKSIDRLLGIISTSLLLLLIFILIILTARPISRTKYDETRSGIDIMVVLDVSRSMEDDDIPPNRMEAAKKVLQDFMGSLEEDRVGLVIFTFAARTLSPLTFDYQIVINHLDGLSPHNQLDYFTWDQAVRSTGGTAIGDGLLLATRKFTDDPERTRVVILITDGEKQGGSDPKLAVDYAKSQNIKIYSIYMGTSESQFLDVSDTKDPFGDLKKISEPTGGKAFEAPTESTLAAIVKEIQNLERTEIEVISTEITRDEPVLLIYLVGILTISYLSVKTIRTKWNS